MRYTHIKSVLQRSVPDVYFTYTGWTIAVILSVTAIQRLRLGEYGWMFTWQLLAVGLLTFVMLCCAVASPHWPLLRATRFGSASAALQQILANRKLRWGGAAIYAAVAFALLLLDHRLIIAVIALLQSAAIIRLKQVTSTRLRLTIIAVSLVCWSLASGLTYTHLMDWLLDAASSSALAVPAFLLAFGLVLVELCGERRILTRTRVDLFIALAAIVVFAAYALRTDNLATEWVPIHRSFFADVAQFVKDGHWLLWDVPSLYGFGSILALAVMPGNGWQALYELTALFLVFEAFTAFLILRWARGGLFNAAFAILLPLATIFGDSIVRYPWSARLYPQGGMRFFWVVGLLLVVFLMYVWRDHEGRVNVLRWVGNIAWLCALLWSIENAVWATMVWVPYLILDAVLEPRAVQSLTSIGLSMIRRLWPIVVFPLTAFVLIDQFYTLRLGAPPDWRAFFEFTGLFTSGKVRAIFFVQPFGAAWTLVLVLGAVGALGLRAVQLRKWEIFRLLMPAWLAVWITSSYFAVEPLDMYISLLLAVAVPVMAMVMYVSRERCFRGDWMGAIVRLSLAPIAIIVIAVALGEPSRLAAMQLPFTHHWTPDVIQEFPTISGELGQLMRHAGIKSTDKVLFPNGDYWTELDQGLILPFGRNQNGKVFLYHSWLPTSPVGPEMLSRAMSPERAGVYIERSLNLSRSTGWYITYRQPALCSDLSPQLVTIRTYSSPNFAAALCAIGGM